MPGAARAVLLMTAKDLVLRSRDRSVYLLGVAAPLGMALILNLTVGDAISGDVHLDLGIVDRDGGPVTEGFTTALQRTEELDVAAITLDGPDQEPADVVREGAADAVVVVPEGFSDAVLAPDLGGDVPALQVVGEVDSEISTRVAAALADGFAGRVDAGRLSVATALAGAGGTGDAGGPADAPGTGPGDPGGLVAAAMAQDAPVQVATLPTADRQLDGATYLMAGISLLFLYLTVQMGVTGLLEEQQLGTLARLHAAPVHRLAVPVAKALGSVVLGVASLAVLVVASTVLMGADWGRPWPVALIGGAAVLAAVSIMGVVAALARTPEQAGSYQSMIALTLAVVGGAFFPVHQAGSEMLSRLAALTPHHWFLRGLGDAQIGLGAAWPSAVALLGFAVVVGGAGGLALHRRAGR